MNAVKQLKRHGKRNFTPVLMVIKGGKYTSDVTEKRIHDFWVFCHSAFWSTELFTREQEAEFKTLIAKHFEVSDRPNKLFKELVQRAVLAKRYVGRSSNRYMPAPKEWFNINNTKGLAGTAKWFNEVSELRKADPDYNGGISWLAEGVLSYAKYKSAADVSAFRTVFIKFEQYELLSMYSNFIIHYSFFNA